MPVAVVVKGLTQIQGRSQGLTVNLLNLPLSALPSDTCWGFSLAKFVLLTTLNVWYNQNRGMLRLTWILGFAVNYHIPKLHPPRTWIFPGEACPRAHPHPHRQMGCFTHMGLQLHPAPFTHLPWAKLNISFTAGIEKGERKNQSRRESVPPPILYSLSTAIFTLQLDHPGNVLWHPEPQY